MNRRKALGRIALAGIGGALAFGGYKWYQGSKTPDIPWLEGQKELLASLADTIIPRTDTPGARDAGAQDFILIMLKESTDRKTQNKFIDGLKDLESYCHSHYNQSFTHCPPADRIAVLTRFEQKDRPISGIVGKVEARYLGNPFFSTLKQYTAVAYCTSELGATRGLRYVLVPAEYHGCVPLQPGQPAWATK